MASFEALEFLKFQWEVPQLSPELYQTLADNPWNGHQSSPSNGPKTGPIKTQRNRPRTRFTSSQLIVLHDRYEQIQYPNRFEIYKLSKEIGLDERVVGNWFTNQRNKKKSDSAKNKPQPKELVQKTDVGPEDPDKELTDPGTSSSSEIQSPNPTTMPPELPLLFHYNQAQYIGEYIAQQIAYNSSQFDRRDQTGYYDPDINAFNFF
ncbi:hypothetical protein DMENIID0001_145410 [Sergentomyia squamirostris]